MEKKKSIFDRISFSLEHLRLLRCEAEMKLKVLKVLTKYDYFLPSSVLHVMISTENHHFKNTIRVHGSVKTASCCNFSPEPQHYLYFDTCKQGLRNNRK